MGKQIKKAHPKKKKVNKWLKICEQCGNEIITPTKVFKCRYCGKVNGVSHDR